jgi:hypothetical protein
MAKKLFKMFIIQKDCNGHLYLIVSIAYFHQNIIWNTGDKVLSGGYWKKSDDNKTITLFGDSPEFGPSSFEDILICLKKGKIFAHHAESWHNITNKYKWSYENAHGEMTDL